MFTVISSSRVDYRPAMQLLDAVRAGVMLRSIHPTELVYLIGMNLEFVYGNEKH